MGCDRKLDYTAVGDTVNMAARFQEMSKTFRGRTPSASRGVLVISESAARRARLDLAMLDVGEVEIRGRTKMEYLHFVDPEIAKKWLEARSASLANANQILQRENARIEALQEAERIAAG
jgi:class 3 adenylate cyclase